MIVSCWNCRGAASRSFARILHDIVKKYGINVMCLLEPRISGIKADRVVKKLGFSNWWRVEATGYAGGIWVLWNEVEVSVEYICSTTQLLHCNIKDKGLKEESLHTFVYGDTNPSKRRELWASLETLSKQITSRWVVLGDFNSFLSPNDKIGGSIPVTSLMSSFQNCITSCNLLEMSVVGDRFTWEKEGVKERLDWVFCNYEWEISHPFTKAYHQASA